MDGDIEREDGSEPTPAAGTPFRARLKVVAHYALLASPVLALLALILAIAALILGHPAPPPPDDSKARIESLSASLAETRNELESLKFILARDRSARAEERKKDDELADRVVQHVSRLESKLKVAPTLEEQLQAADGTPVPVSPPAVPSAQPAPVAPPPVVVPQAAPVPAKKAAPAPAKKVSPAPAKKTVPAPARKATPVPAKKATPAKKTAPVPAKKVPQTDSLKDAIEQFNETSPKKR